MKMTWYHVLCGFGAAFALVYVTLAPRVSAAPVAQSAIPLDLAVLTDKKSYTLGELVSVKVSLTNKGRGSLSIYEHLDVWNGHLKVFIASEGGEFREYIGPDWGTRDSVNHRTVPLAPGASLEATATVLYNQRVDTAHLSPLYAERINKGRIPTDYAFSKPGKYRVKAVLHDIGFADKVESAPFTITITRPEGNDLAIWNLLKTDADYGYFIQTGGPKGAPNEAKSQKIITDLAEVVSLHPGAKQVQSIRAGLSKHNASQNAALEKSSESQSDLR